MHEQRREPTALERNLDMLDPRAHDDPGGIAKAIDAALVRFQSLRLGLQEAFAHVIVVGGAQQIRCGSGLAPLSQVRTAGMLDGLGFARPFAKPRAVVADVAAQAQPDAVDLADLGSPPGRGVQADEHAVRPAIVLGKVHE